MADSRALYEQVILDHTKNPRNFGPMEPCDHKVEGYNPLCGDQYTIYVRLEGDVIADVRFEGNGCAISKASASMMTQALKGKSKSEAEALFTRFHQMVTSNPDSPINKDDLGKLTAFSGIREYPIRIKCATLAWHALSAALEGNKDEITTE